MATSQEIKQILSESNMDSTKQLLLMKEVETLRKQVERLDFMQKRTLNDKEIAVTLLNQTILDLKQQEEETQRANAALALVNEELYHQKALVEEKSKNLEINLHELKLSYEELEQFSYIASHDLKSPLRTISTYAQLFKRNLHNTDTHSDYLDKIIMGTKLMYDTIHDLLELSKAGKYKGQQEQTNFNEVIDIVKFNLQEEILDNHAAIHCHDLPVLALNQSAMVLVFQNLINNAIKYRSESQPNITISAKQSSGYWQFSIGDNGIGLDEQYQEKVFQPFQRVHVETHNGSGMGLAICKKIINHHRGDIWYQQKPEGGTVFNFTLQSAS